MTEKEKKKKEPTFKKVKDGLIFISEGAVFVGLPTEVEKKGSIEGGAILPIGGKGRGEKYSKTKYSWVVITGSPIPVSDLDSLKDLITETSGTIVTSLDNATIATIKCKKCGHLNLANSKFCSNCGNAL